MSRASRITMALEELKAAGFILAYAQLDRRRWIIQIGDRDERYYTSNEAEAFITGALVATEE